MAASFSPHIHPVPSRTAACRLGAMPSLLSALLCAGLFLSHRSSAQRQTPSKPTIWAEPGFMVPQGRPVNIWCRGAPRAVEYRLYFEGQPSALAQTSLSGIRTRVGFRIPAMTSRTAGQYSCAYHSGGLWSELSDPLDLVVTGMYDTPTLTVHPGPVVNPGENVTFSCRLDTATSRFFLLREGQRGRPRQKYGSVPAQFALGPVTAAHAGTYRCFGSYNSHTWSFPSESVRLLVAGVGNTSGAPAEDTPSPDPWDTYFSPTEPGVWRDLALQNYTTQNLLRIGLALLVLAVLVCLLVEDQLSRKTTQRMFSRQE